MRRALLLLPLVLGAVALPASAAVAAPPNDDRAAAQVIPTLPVTVAGSTIDATSGPGSPDAAPDVWYRYTAATGGRLSLTLAAGGDLEGSVQAYALRRSTLVELGAEETDEDGAASITFAVTAGQVVLVRVAQAPISASAPFTLRFSAAAQPVRPPGTALTPAGATVTLERVLRPAAAFNVTLRAGRTYRVATSGLAVAPAAAPSDEDDDDEAEDDAPACGSRLELYRPGTTDFDDTSPALSLGCGDYELFTPGRGESGRWLLRASVPSSVRGAQRLHLQLAGAGTDDTAPGRYLDNHSAVGGTLQGTRINRVDLYRFQLRSRSALSLVLARGADELGLTLRTDTGQTVESGGDGAIRRDLAPGRYFVSVEAPAGVDARYVLRRASRTITRSSVAISGVTRARGRLGQALTVSVRTRPAVSGLVRLTFSRFDPIAGWQYLATRDVRSAAGRATTAFRAPALGRFRVRAEYLGTRDAAPSATGFASVLVTSG